MSETTARGPRTHSRAAKIALDVLIVALVALGAWLAYGAAGPAASSDTTPTYQPGVIVPGETNTTGTTTKGYI